jgi:hypothetical protein
MVASTAPACPHCGYRPGGSAVPNSLNITAVVILLGGVLFAVGSFLPWATASSAFASASKSGMEGGDGMITVFLGIVIALLGLMRLQRPGLPGSRAAMVLLGVIALGLAIFEGANISNRLAETTSAYVVTSVGIGIYVMGVGAVLVIAASLFGAQAKPPVPTATPVA